MARFLRFIHLALRRGLYVRSRSVVYFMMSIFVPTLLCMYWVFALRDNPNLASQFRVEQIVSYYVVIVTLSALLISHMKEWIMREEIQQGGLSRMLLKPYSYYAFNALFHELPYRIVQGGYGVIIVGCLSIIFPHLFMLSDSLPLIGLAMLSSVLGFFICHNIEQMLGFLAFWLYDLRLIHNAYDTLFILLGGVNMPLFLFPDFLERVAFLTPLPYIIYVPTLLFTGQAHPEAVSGYIATQMLWLIGTSILYQIVWRAGVKAFTAAGN